MVSVDIFSEVTDRAARLLDATGYGGRVTVVLADAEHAIPDAVLFDAVCGTASPAAVIF
ncbi:hypothetical protein [Nonomuraea sp. NPDC049129]|uniref:hypothetical protein n=1 Tax=Nonomuraea sp. NPDC049129 TaxID=3155272 RepID=UPI003406DA19